MGERELVRRKVREKTGGTPTRLTSEDKSGAWGKSEIERKASGE